MAPLAKSLIGSEVLGEYFDAYASALNRAAARYEEDEVGVQVTTSSHQQHAQSSKEGPFSLVAVRNVGMTSSLLFARDAAAVSDVRTAEVGFGAGDMANKGAVGLRLLYTTTSRDDEEGSADVTRERKAEMTFVTTHLAAMEWNLAKRNKNWASLVSGLAFEDPRKVFDRAAARSRDNGGGHHTHVADRASSDEREGLLEGDLSALDRELHDLSIYKPGTHLFVAGDLNYRISTTSPETEDVFPSVDPESPEYYPKFLERDQLTQERRAGRTLHGLSEAEIKFPPTYKLDCLPKDEDGGGDSGNDQNGFATDDVKWKWAIHRWPGWCDRILYRSTPRQTAQIRVLAYDALPPIRTSDHRPVYLRVQVPLISPEELADIPDAILDDTQGGDDGQGVVDTRVKLPFPVDLDAWTHRETVRKMEHAMGWSLLAAQSKQTMAAVLVTLFLLGAGTWWFNAV